MYVCLPYTIPLTDPIQSPSLTLSVVLGNFKSSDWSTRFMQVILPVLSLVSISWGTPNLYCGSADYYMCTQTGTEAGFIVQL